MKQEIICVEEKPQFEIGQLLPIGMTLIVLTIGLAYGLSVLADVRDDMDAGSAERNATADGITAIAKIPEKLSLIVTIIIAAVIIGILIRYLWVRYSG